MYIPVSSLKEFWHNRFKLLGALCPKLVSYVKLIKLCLMDPLTAVEATSFQ